MQTPDKMSAQKIYTQKKNEYKNYDNAEHEDIVKQDLYNIFADYTYEEIKQTYSSQLMYNNLLVPTFSDDFTYDFKDYIDCEHYYQALVEFKLQYFLKHVLPKFTTKKDIVECIIGVFIEICPGLSHIGSCFTLFKKELEKEHNKKATTCEPSSLPNKPFD